MQELEIIIVAKHHRPTLLNLAFLQAKDIVPKDWQLAHPVSSNQSTQIVFQNGVKFTAQANRLILAEAIKDQPLPDLKIPEIAHRYVQALPKADYEIIELQIRQTAPASETSGEDYIIDRLIATGPWTQVGNAPVKAALQLLYALEDRQLVISVNPAQIQQPQASAMPMTLFTGNFRYAIRSNTSEEQLTGIAQVLSNWQRDINTFHDLIQTRFLSPASPAHDPPEPDLPAPKQGSSPPEQGPPAPRQNPLAPAPEKPKSPSLWNRLWKKQR